MSDEDPILQSRLAEFEKGLLAMQDVIKGLPTETQAERAIEGDARLSRVTTLVTIGIGLLLVLLALLGFQSWSVASDAHNNRQGILCLIEQFEEHRQANQSAHQAFSKRLEAPYEVAPGQGPPPVPRELEAACRDFIDVNAAQGGRVELNGSAGRP